MTRAVALFFYCLIYAILNVSGAAIIKWKLEDKALSNFENWLGFLFQIPVLLAFMVIFLSALVMFKALSTSNFTLVIPIASDINFFLTIFVGVLIFKDSISYETILGMAFIIIGITILSLNSSPYGK